MRATDRADYRFHPLIGHIEPNICLNADGSLMAMFQISGIAAELAGVQNIVQARNQDIFLLNALGDDRFEWWDHFVRSEDDSAPELPRISNWFVDRYDRAYHATQVSGTRYTNELFVTVLMHPARRLQGLRALFAKDRVDPEEADLQDFRTLLQQVKGSLSRYGCRTLGVRERDGLVFSEVAEALYRIANCRFEPIGLSPTRMGRFITPERIVFGVRDLHVMQAGAERFCSVLTLHDYPAQMSPTMFAQLRVAPFPVVITSASRFQHRSSARDKALSLTKRMQASEDLAEEQIDELKRDTNAIASGRETYVHHHWSTAIHARTLEDLDRRVAKAQAMLNEVAVKSTRESIALQPAYYAQIPGNRYWRTRPGQVKMVDIADFGAKHGVLRGEARSRWGAPILMLPTTARTIYNFHFHIQGVASMSGEDLGHCLIIGRAGSGKTSLMASLCLLALRNPDVRVMVIDKDYGLSVAVRAANGSYMDLPLGTDSGIVPLKALADTEEDKAFLHRWMVTYLINTPDAPLVELTDDEDRSLRRSIALQMRMPPEQRELANIVAMMGNRNQSGAGVRLRRWCRGESLGWAFDGERDKLDMQPRIVGVETGKLLKDKTVSAAMLSLLSYRQDKLIDGRPFLKAIDELWQMDRIEAAREEHNDQLKTLRKQEGVMMLSTQSASDALSSPIAHTFRQQIPNKIFFGDDSATYEDLVDGMGLTHAEYLAVKTQLPNMRHTFLLKRPSGSVLCRFDLSNMPEMVAVVSARESTYRLMNHYRKLHGPAPEQWLPHFERHAPRLAMDPSLLAEAAE